MPLLNMKSCAVLATVVGVWGYDTQFSMRRSTEMAHTFNDEIFNDFVKLGVWYYETWQEFHNEVWPTLGYVLDRKLKHYGTQQSRAGNIWKTEWEKQTTFSGDDYVKSCVAQNAGYENFMKAFVHRHPSLFQDIQKEKRKKEDPELEEQQKDDFLEAELQQLTLQLRTSEFEKLRDWPAKEELENMLNTHCRGLANFVLEENATLFDWFQYEYNKWATEASVEEKVTFFINNIEDVKKKWSEWRKPTKKEMLWKLAIVNARDKFDESYEEAWTAITKKLGADDIDEVVTHLIEHNPDKQSTDAESQTSN